MANEIERKFIVPLWYHHTFLGLQGGTEVTQAYLAVTPDAGVRLRIARTPDKEEAKVTVKGRSSEGGLVRPEWEWSVPLGEARGMITTLRPPVLVKTRHVVMHGDDAWEVDVLRVNSFPGRAPVTWRHLVVAEYEGPTLEQVRGVALPEWVGREVTGDPTFAMAALTTEEARYQAWLEAYDNRPAKG
jgi:adenylate cyclase